MSIARREEQDLARQHPLRLQILALAQRPGQSLDPRDLRQKLPKCPTVAVVEYHLKVLREVELIPAITDDDDLTTPDPTPRELFAKNLRHLRGVRRMTQEEVARLTEMHRTEISLLERGQREPRLGTLIKLSAVLEFPMRDFFEGIEWAPEQPEATAGSFVAVPVEGDSAPAPTQLGKLLDRR